MPGKIKRLLDCIIETRAQGDDVIAQATKTKLILKGVNPNNYTNDSDDDPGVIVRVLDIAAELGVSLSDTK